MYIVAIAWLYVTLMMAVAEAASPSGSIVGAVFTFVIYGAIPLSILIYIWWQVVRRRQRYQPSLSEPMPGNHAQTMTPASQHSELVTPDTSSKPPA